MVPSSRPQMSKLDVEKILKFMGVDRDKFPVCVLAVRGYYLDSMGVKGVNDRGIYDDAVFVDSPTLFASTNWNTDPSKYRKGKGTGSGKGIASLKEGVWDYKIGKHKGKGPAGNQAAKVTVVRDGVDGDYEDTGYFGINLHWGGKGTSSLGCQTAPPNQWPSFINPLVAELKRYDQKVFKYVLIDEETRRNIVGEVALTKAVRDDLSPALALIEDFEGLRLKAYKDPVGIPTIGYGTIKYPNGQKVKMGDVITKDQAIQYLREFVNTKCVPHIEKVVKVPLTNNQKCALISFVYNLGSIRAGSGLLTKLNVKDYKGAAEEILKWNKAGGKTLAGLVRRRKAERELFLKA